MQSKKLQFSKEEKWSFWSFCKGDDGGYTWPNSSIATPFLWWCWFWWWQCKGGCTSPSSRIVRLFRSPFQEIFLLRSSPTAAPDRFGIEVNLRFLEMLRGMLSLRQLRHFHNLSTIIIVARLWRVGLFDFGSGSGRVWPKSSGFGFGYCAYYGLKANSLVIWCNSILCKGTE